MRNLSRAGRVSGGQGKCPGETDSCPFPRKFNEIWSVRSEDTVGEQPG